MKIGLIGAGNIGQFLLKTINLEKRAGDSRIDWLLDERETASQKMPEIEAQYGCKWIKRLDAFLESDADLIVECTNPSIAKGYVNHVLNGGKNLLIVSVGVFADSVLLEEAIQLSLEKNRQIYVPSGAIGGLDALAAANSLGLIQTIKLTTRKPPKAFSLDLHESNEAVSLFKGNAKDAIIKFPTNINVAVTLSLAGVGVENTEVEIVADPRIAKNCHEIIAEGEFGSITISLENEALPQNPKTSYLAALSVLATIQRLNGSLKIGV